MFVVSKMDKMKSKKLKFINPDKAPGQSQETSGDRDPVHTEGGCSPHEKSGLQLCCTGFSSDQECICTVIVDTPATAPNSNCWLWPINDMIYDCITPYGLNACLKMKVIGWRWKDKREGLLSDFSQSLVCTALRNPIPLVLAQASNSLHFQTCIYALRSYKCYIY